MSPGCVVSWTAVGPSRPGPTSVARVDAAACKNKPQSVGELVNSHDHTALGEIWAWAGCSGVNTKIATAPAIARNKLIGTPRYGEERKVFLLPVVHAKLERVSRLPCRPIARTPPT